MKAGMTPMCIQDLVEAQAKATPHAIAIREEYKQLTYGELDARARQLAHVLRELGVGPEELVALCTKRSADFVVGALGILKAGAAYIPLDPDYPEKRLSQLLSESGTQLVVTHSLAAHQLPAGNWRTILLDAVATTTGECPRGTPEVQTKPDSLAYVIFTSGSTGFPKGVQITHANLLNLVRWHQRAFKITPLDRATICASPGFDAATWEVWPYLAAGASLCLVDEAVRTTPQSLRDWMVAKGITVSFLPTALAESVLELQWPPATSLRMLLTGADTLHRYPPAGLPFALVNNYGPTECTVVATSGTVPSNAQSGEPPTIGCPIDDVRVLIVDEHMNPVPTGTPGELLIGGSGVGRGYLNLPELTAEKFVPDPFSEDQQARLYKTGDLARYLPNGEIAFLGRIDDQIKIRGYRIEPEEIRRVLNCHPHIRENLVAAREDTSGDKRLVGYVVPAVDADLNASDLRSFLSEYLPDYMVPSTFVALEQIPLTSHGKFDRAALPAPNQENTLEEDAFVQAESKIEERLASMVTVLLGVPRVGMDDNFFNLGGHSLLGAQLIARIQDAFGVELSLLSLFDDPTVRGMASEVERLILATVQGMSEAEAQHLLASSQD